MPSLSIYLPDSIMEKVVVEAKEDDTSISKVLTKNYLSSEKVYDPTALIFDRLDLVEKKLDGINEQLAYISGIVLGLASKSRKHQMVYPLEPQETQKPVAEYPETVEDKVIGTVSNFIKERDYQFHVKPPKGSVKANAAMNSFFKPQPKLKDKAKK